MTHLLFLIPLSIAMGLVGFGAFVWALRNGQFDDPEGNALRVLDPETAPHTEGTIEDREAAGKLRAPRSQDANALNAASQAANESRRGAQ